jgi:hypothetical protein
MPKIPTQTSDYDFKVEQVPLYDAQGRNTGFFGNQRTDDGTVLGVTSERYGIIDHGRCIDVAEDAFEKADLGGYDRKVIITGEGARMRAHYDFRDKTKKVKVGDEVGLRLTLQNSYDRTLRVSFALGMLRLVCTNGMTTMENEESMTKKHSTDVSTDFIVEALGKAINKWDKAMGKLDALTDAAVSQDQGLIVLGNLVRVGALSDRMSAEIAKVWNSPDYVEDESRNLYNLNNAVTQHLTRNVEDTRAELSERVSRNVFKRLYKGATQETELQKLLLPLKTVDVKSN